MMLYFPNRQHESYENEKAEKFTTGESVFSGDLQNAFYITDPFTERLLVSL